MHPAIFLDRDGVIIENRENYVRSWDDVAFIPEAVSALSQIKASPFKIIFVTNQSVVGRGLISLETVETINRRIINELIASGCRVDGSYLCPHAPFENCPCRKPKPGLILQAASELSLDLSKSMVIGDAWSDLQAGASAGIPTLALLLTGRGQDQILLPQPPDFGKVNTFASLSDALRELVRFP